MYFQRPEAFYLILPLAFIVLGLALYSRAARRRAMAAFVDAAMAPRILPEESTLRFWSKLALWELGRVLKPGGHLIMTSAVLVSSEDTKNVLAESEFGERAFTTASMRLLVSRRAAACWLVPPPCW